jgi:hypothetical protein
MNERGTYCVMIESRLITAVCPLGPGGCMWRHRVSGICTYDADFAEEVSTATEFAARVGLQPVDPEVETIIRRSVTEVLKSELST